MKPVPPHPERQARDIAARLQQNGFEAYWVGGCVRDRLLGRLPQDFDIATSARPDEIERLFSQTVPVGRQFGVVVVRLEGVSYQVSTFRAEGPYLDGRRPSSVRFTDAVEDARRRDLTVNGLFYDPVRGQLHDWVEGQLDLERKRIRMIGDPVERLGEDHLRLLRVPRFAAQLAFDIEPSTLAAVRSHAAGIRTVSAERVRDELRKLFQYPHAARGLDLLRETGLLQEVLPEVAAFERCEQSPDYHPEGTVYQHVRRMLELLPETAGPRLPWAVILHDVAKPVTASRDPVRGSIHFYGHEKAGAEMAHSILERLRFSRQEIDEITAVVRHHMQFKDAAQMRQATRRRIIMRPSYPLERELHRLDCLGSHGDLASYECFRAEERALAQRPDLLPPLLNGEDLMTLGLKPGPPLGKLLAEIRDKQLQEELTTREAALDWARERIARLMLPKAPS